MNTRPSPRSHGRNLLLTFLLLAVGTAPLCAETGSPYRTYTSGQQTVFFILPRTLKRVQPSRAVSDYTYDVTCNTTNDSISVTGTIETASALPNDSVSIHFPNGTIRHYPTERLYADLHGHNTRYRICFYIPAHEFRRIYEDTTPAMFNFGDRLNFSFSRSKWKKECEQMNAILRIFEVNTKH